MSRHKPDERGGPVEQQTFERILDPLGQAVDEGAFGRMAKPRVCEIEKAAYLVSTFQSALYFLEHMRLATNFPSRGRLIDYALDQAPADGLILEMGVGDGARMESRPTA